MENKRRASGNALLSSNNSSYMVKESENTMQIRLNRNAGSLMKKVPKNKQA